MTGGAVHWQIATTVKTLVSLMLTGQSCVCQIINLSEKLINQSTFIFLITVITFPFLNTSNRNTVKTELWCEVGVKTVRTEEKLGHKLMKSLFVCVGVAPSPPVQHALMTVGDQNHQMELPLDLRHRRTQAVIKPRFSTRSRRLLQINRKRSVQSWTQRSGLCNKLSGVTDAL